MRVVVIGAGFVGAPLCRLLAGAGHDVLAATRSGGAGSQACDVAASASVAALAEAAGAVDVAVHCASSGRGGDRVARYRSVYLQGCGHLLQVLRPDRLVFVSSSSVYGQTDGSRVDERAATVPSTATGRVLLEAERCALASGGAVARLAGIYGPGRSYLLRRYLEGTAQIDGDSPNAAGRWINQIHRDDAAAAVAQLVGGHHAGVFNVADDTPLQQRPCYEEFRRRFGGEMPPVRPADRNKARGWSDKRVSNAKLRATGWAARYPCYFDALDNDPELVPSILAGG